MSDKKIFQTAGALWFLAVLTFWGRLTISFENGTLGYFSKIGNEFIKDYTSSTGIILGLTLGVISFVALIAATAPLYIIFRRYDTTFALMGTLLLTAGGIVGVGSDAGWMAISQLGEMVVSGGNSEAAGIEGAALAIVTTSNWGWGVSALLISIGSMIFNYLLVVRVAGAKWLGWSGMFATGLAVVSIPTVLITGLEEPSIALYLPIQVWALVFGYWLLNKKKQHLSINY